MNSIQGFDFEIYIEGSISLLTPLSDAARDWTDENIGDDAQWHGHGFAVERRFIEDVLVGIIIHGGMTVGDCSGREIILEVAA